MKKPRKNRRELHRGTSRGNTPPKISQRQRRLSTDETPSDADKESKFGWVTIEHRDSDGNPTLPKEMIASTYHRKYSDVPQETKISAYILAGYKPMPLLMVERKIYEIHRLSLKGWRRRGLLSIEIENWRYHEAEWFDAMQGISLEVSDPGLPGPHNEKSQYYISNSSFNRKIVTYVDTVGAKNEVQIYEGTLDATETWNSALRRHGVEVVGLGFKLLLAPLLVALGAGLAMIWMKPPPEKAIDEAPVAESPAHRELHSINANAPREQSEKSAIGNISASRTTETLPPTRESDIDPNVTPLGTDVNKTSP